MSFEKPYNNHIIKHTHNENPNVKNSHQNRSLRICYENLNKKKIGKKNNTHMNKDKRKNPLL
jgi:hypothetical protein